MYKLLPIFLLFVFASSIPLRGTYLDVFDEIETKDTMDVMTNCSYSSNEPHTYHNVTVSACATCQFAHLYEVNFYFVDLSTNKTVNKFILGPDDVFQYGMVLTNYSDFNMLYSLTCVQNNNKTSQSPKVAFVIGADGPAQPNINVLNYYGAKGNFEIVPGIGENYQIYFP
jgi:hypothetical protein